MMKINTFSQFFKEENVSSAVAQNENNTYIFYVISHYKVIM